MFTPRAIFSRLFLQICPSFRSLYTLGRLVTLSCEISDQSPITCVNSHYRVWAPFDPLSPNMKGIGWRVAELWPFEVFQNVWWIGPEVGRMSLVVGRSVVGRQYSYFLHWSHILLFRYVPNVAWKRSYEISVRSMNIDDPRYDRPTDRPQGLFTLWKTSNGHNSATRRPIDFVFVSKVGFFGGRWIEQRHFRLYLAAIL